MKKHVTTSNGNTGKFYFSSVMGRIVKLYFCPVVSIRKCEKIGRLELQAGNNCSFEGLKSLLPARWSGLPWAVMKF